MFIDLVGFRSALGKSLAANASRFTLFDDVSADLIVSRLGADGYSYLVISDNTRHEIVKVSVNNGMVFLDRGQSGTAPIPHPCGASVVFEWTAEGLADQIKQNTEDLCADPCADPDMPDAVKLPPCEAGCDARVEITTATHTYYLDENRCLIATPLPPAITVRDGEYCMGDNSYITVKDGRIIFIQEGDCGISKGCAKCGCNTSDCGCTDPCIEDTIPLVQ